MSRPRYAPPPPLRRLAALFLVPLAVLLLSSTGTGPAGAQDGHEPDPQVVADVWGFAAETGNGSGHVLRWMRVLTTFGVVEEMTSAEAQEMAGQYWAERWDPVVAELQKLEDGQGQPDPQVVADVRGFAAETGNGFDHVLRWMRVLAAFGAVEAITSAEAQGYAEQYTASRWDPVVAELRKLEGSTTDPDPTATPASGELSVSISASPAHPGPGEVVRLSADIANAPSGANPSYQWLLDLGGGQGIPLGTAATASYGQSAGAITFRVTVSYDTGDSATSTHAVEWTDSPPNRAPVVDTQAARYAGFAKTGNAPRGMLVWKVFSDIFSDPDGDELTYTASVPDDRSHLLESLQTRLGAGSGEQKEDFLFLELDTEDDWKALSPALPDPFTTTVTLTATDPEGLSVAVTGDFLTDWDSEPALVSATAGKRAIELTFDLDVQTTPSPAPDRFTVNVTNEDGSAGTVTVSGVSVDGKVVTLALASALQHGQTVTLDYAHDDDAPLQRSGGGDSAPAFTGQAVEVSIPDPCPDGTPRVVLSIRVENTFNVNWFETTVPAGCELTGYIVELDGDDGSEASSPLLGPNVGHTVVESPGSGEYQVTVRAIFAEAASSGSSGPETGRSAFARVASSGLDTDWRRFAPGDDPPRRAFQNGVPANCNLTLNLSQIAGYEVFGEWTTAALSCQDNVNVQHKRKARTTWDSSGWFNAGVGFVYGHLDPVEYDFRVQLEDDDGGVNTSAESTIMVSDNPSVTTQVGRAENVRVVMRNNNDASVYWDAPKSTPTGLTVDGFWVEYWEDGKKSTTLKRAKWYDLSDSTEGDILYPAGARASHPSLFDHDGDSANDGPSGMIRLTMGAAYRVQVVTKLVGTNISTSATSAATRLPQTAMFEPLKAWFIDNTPNYNAALGRIFMMVDTSKANATAQCFINGGNQINCPPRTLVSLDTNPGGDYSVRVAAQVNVESIGNSQAVMRLNGAHDSHVTNQSPANLRVSAGNNRMLVTWNVPQLHVDARADAYVIETRHSNDSGANWSSWTAAAVLDKSHCEMSYGDHRLSTNATSCSQLLTDLNHQMYQVHVRLRTLHAELLAGRTELNVADASGISANDVIQIDDERMLVSAKSDNTLTVTRGHLSSTAAKHNSPTETTLSGTLNSTVTSLSVADASDIAANDVIQVDSERMLVTAVSTNTLTVTRAHSGTTAAAHSNGAAVYKVTAATEVYVLDSATTAAAALNASATSLAVADASGIAANSVIQIGDERMLVTAVSGNTLTLTRGHLGTTAAAHSNGAAVYLVSQATTLTRSWFLGMSSLTAILTMPTTPTGLAGPVSNLVIRYPGAGKLRVQWDKPADDGGAAVVGYIVRYRVSGSNGPYTERYVHPRDVLRYCAGGGGCTNPRSLTLSGLTSNTRYDIQIAALNANGRGVFTSVGFSPAPD